MKIFRFDRQSGRTIDRFDSSGFIVARLAYLLDEATIHCAYLDPNGLIGRHQASMPQLFFVAQGKGWVRGEMAEKTWIQVGQAAYWGEGEWHEAGSETGMTAIIIEAPRFDISEWIPLA